MFGSENAKAVLEDLAKAMLADASTFDPNPRVHAFNEGRREAVLYIRRRIEEGRRPPKPVSTKETI